MHPNNISQSLGTPFSRRRLVTGALALGAMSALRFAPIAGAQSPESSPVAFMLVNLNAATDAEILAIPGLNKRMLKEFKEYRPYGSIVQFRKEIGKYAGDDQIKTWETYLFVPIEANQSDADTLEQLPGVTADIAKKLTDGRPYDTNQAFLDALKSLVSAADFQNADNYLAEMK